MTRSLKKIRWKPAKVPEFHDQFNRLVKKDPALLNRLEKKMRQILSDPYMGEPKSYNLKGVRGSHVDPYVIVYKILENKNTVLFIFVDHHDVVYKKAPIILEKISSTYL